MAWNNYTGSRAGTFLSDEEIDRVVEQCTEVEQVFEHELVNLKIEQDGAIDAEAIRKRDDLYESAIEVVLREGRGSCSLLQRALGIGYGRAARMIDYMAEDGIVGQHNGSSAREIQMTMEEWELIKHGTVAVDGEEWYGENNGRRLFLFHRRICRSRRRGCT